ncbi:hypothetical protein SAMN02745823_01197 [Sporobacter termitidis DSM 10068]|uniref:DUF1858 domain-containing protein n=1 Tax=Sporobacter termitidis DSM 10068 TaxID=1123282 RepID=A0A1M5WCN6_9FIRM|nr:hypothetical protein [Sporobacter termitidis]SHH85266.1 hypothetical protein SAMN02745823_01197 [Sporobacter termitidis DSM 10068]
MDLQNNEITIGALISNGAAKALLKKEFPEVANPLMLQMAKKMTLASVLNLARDRYPQEKIQRVLLELQAL